MTTPGVEAIAEEREEQIHKHGFTPAWDADQYRGETALMKAALCYLSAAQAAARAPQTAEEIRCRVLAQGNDPEQNAYFVMARDDFMGNLYCDSIPYTQPDWPWDMEWWKPSNDPIDNLVRAGALIAAEIDRLMAEREASC